MTIDILIIGGGGREHALAWKIAQSPHCGRLYCAPGNPGIARLAQCLALPLEPPAFTRVIEACRALSIGLVVVGPERPLAEGIADALAEAGIPCFGPRRAAAQLEASKRFAKELMREAGIPTAEARTFTDLAQAQAHLETCPPPWVIKASGLAEGKGVTVAHTRAEAEAALRACLEQGVFGAAGKEVLVEAFLEGEEASLLAFVDGQTALVMDAAQDHKPVFDGDRGPNTGGMGAYSPAPVVTDAVRRRCEERIFAPCLAALRARGIDYRGVLYAGLMIGRDGLPRVVEFNCRFGDPETQALLPRLESDLVEVMLACIQGRLGDVRLQWSPKAAVCVVAASGGYPGPYEKHKRIEGLDQLPADEDVIVFHAGTALDAQGNLVTAGGRVLGVTARAADLRAAVERAYTVLRRIRFDGMHYRTDIARRALERSAPSAAKV